jgi:hypothetical protein
VKAAAAASRVGWDRGAGGVGLEGGLGAEEQASGAICEQEWHAPPCGEGCHERKKMMLTDGARMSLRGSAKTMRCTFLYTPAAVPDVGEFRKTRHPRNVEFNKVLEACFSGAGSSRFSEARNL